jgi:HEAT repeat protein
MIRLVVERRSEVILRAIAELLGSQELDVRRTAAWALSVSPYPPAVPSLKTLLDDQDEQTRDYARVALIRSGGLDSAELALE